MTLEIGGESGKIGTNGGQMAETVTPVEENEDDQKQTRMIIRNANYNTR
jgi:hypothetical protein